MNCYKKLIFFIKWLFNKPYLIALLSVALSWFIAFAFTDPVYETCDDLLMRMTVDGSGNKYAGSSDFLMFINTYYGYMLKKLYMINSHIGWYDLIFYTLISLSLFVNTLLLQKSGEKYLIYNIFSFLTLSAIYIPIFCQPQFSTVSGLSAVSVFIIFYKMLNNKEDLKKRTIIWSCFLILFFAVFSSLIRFHIFFLISLLALPFLLFILKYYKRRKLRFLGYCIFLLFCMIINLFLFVLFNNEINNIPERKYFKDYNKEATKLYDYSVATTNLIYPWEPIETKVKDLENKLAEVQWQKGDLMLMLSWGYLGNNNIFSIQKLKKVNDLIYKDISTKNNSIFNFSIIDYGRIFAFICFIYLMVFICFYKKRNINYSLFSILLFILAVISLSYLFKGVPHRVWISIIALFLMLLLLKIQNDNPLFILSRNINLLSDKKTLKQILTLFLIITFAFICYLPIRKTIKTNRTCYRSTYKALKNNYKKLDDSKVYLLSIIKLNSIAIPFNNIILNSNKKFLRMAIYHAPEQKKLLKSYNIPDKDTWEYICSTGNVEFIAVKNEDDFYINQIYTALKIHMKQRYNKDIIFLPSQKYGFLQTYKCEYLSKEEADILRKIKYYNNYGE